MVKLSITVITMNRSEQLREALGSCLACRLPDETEFVILDNASTDDTEATVRDVLENSGYKYSYERVAENLGVGGGRCYAYARTVGEYVYVLDDDAVIDFENNPDFFIKALNILDEEQDVITLSTQIYDTAWERNRVKQSRKLIRDNLYMCVMFCGGSHFIRRSFFKEPPYLPNKYGWEEFPPSMRVYDSGKCNAFCSELLIIHKPKVNKWLYDNQENAAVLVNGIAGHYALKSMIYPATVFPFVWLTYLARRAKFIKGNKSMKRQAKEVIHSIKTSYPQDKRIRFSTFVKLVKYFGIKIL